MHRKAVAIIKEHFHEVLKYQDLLGDKKKLVLDLLPEMLKNKAKDVFQQTLSSREKWKILANYVSACILLLDYSFDIYIYIYIIMYKIRLLYIVYTLVYICVFMCMSYIREHCNLIQVG